MAIIINNKNVLSKLYRLLLKLFSFRTTVPLGTYIAEIYSDSFYSWHTNIFLNYCHIPNFYLCCIFSLRGVGQDLLLLAYQDVLIGFATSW